jgi:hypothetical protein
VARGLDVSCRNASLLQPFERRILVADCHREREASIFRGAAGWNQLGAEANRPEVPMQPKRHCGRHFQEREPRQEKRFLAAGRPASPAGSVAERRRGVWRPGRAEEGSMRTGRRRGCSCRSRRDAARGMDYSAPQSRRGYSHEEFPASRHRRCGAGNAREQRDFRHRIRCAVGNSVRCAHLQGKPGMLRVTWSGYAPVCQARWLPVQLIDAGR